MFIKKSAALIISLLILVVSGCTTNYLYSSRGSLKYSTGDVETAVLYWKGDEGRLWYGARYKALESGLTLRVCNQIPTAFEPVENVNNETLTLLNQAMDFQTARVDSDGRIINLGQDKMLEPRNVCGRIFVENKATDIEGLNKGSRPEVIFLCKNNIKTKRYPLPGKYIFGEIDKYEIESGSGEAPSPCVTLDYVPPI